MIVDQDKDLILHLSLLSIFLFFSSPLIRVNLSRRHFLFTFTLTINKLIAATSHPYSPWLPAELQTRVRTCFSVTGIKVISLFLTRCISELISLLCPRSTRRDTGISTIAATLRLRRVNDYVAKLVNAREVAQKS